MNLNTHLHDDGTTGPVGTSIDGCDICDEAMRNEPVAGEAFVPTDQEKERIYAILADTRISQAWQRSMIDAIRLDYNNPADVDGETFTEYMERIEATGLVERHAQEDRLTAAGVAVDGGGQSMRPGDAWDIFLEDGTRLHSVAEVTAYLARIEANGPVAPVS